MASLLRNAVLSKNVSLLKCIKGRPVATAPAKKNAAHLVQTTQKRDNHKCTVHCARDRDHNSKLNLSGTYQSTSLSIRNCTSCINITPEAKTWPQQKLGDSAHSKTNQPNNFTTNSNKTTRCLLRANSLQEIPKRGYTCPCPCPPCTCAPCNGCLPPPCNTSSPRCLQWMCGYYYYPYGCWFCGPYHVGGACCSVGANGPISCPPCVKATCPVCVCPAATTIGQEDEVNLKKGQGRVCNRLEQLKGNYAQATPLDNVLSGKTYQLPNPSISYGQQHMLPLGEFPAYLKPQIPFTKVFPISAVPDGKSTINHTKFKKYSTRADVYRTFASYNSFGSDSANDKLQMSNTSSHALFKSLTGHNTKCCKNYIRHKNRQFNRNIKKAKAKFTTKCSAKDRPDIKPGAFESFPNYRCTQPLTEDYKPL